MIYIKGILTVVLCFVVSTTHAQTTIRYFDRGGVETGRARIEDNSYPYRSFKGSEYKSALPIQQIYSALSQKQQIYDKRLAIIVNKVQLISRDIIYLYKDEPDDFRYYYSNLKKLTDYITSLKIDYTNTRDFNDTYNILDELHDGVLNYYELE